MRGLCVVRSKPKVVKLKFYISSEWNDKKTKHDSYTPFFTSHFRTALSGNIFFIAFNVDWFHLPPRSFQWIWLFKRFNSRNPKLLTFPAKPPKVLWHRAFSVCYSSVRVGFWFGEGLIDYKEAWGMVVVVSKKKKNERMIVSGKLQEKVQRNHAARDVTGLTSRLRDSRFFFFTNLKKGNKQKSRWYFWQCWYCHVFAVGQSPESKPRFFFLVIAQNIPHLFLNLIF